MNQRKILPPLTLDALRIAMQNALVCFLAYLAGFYFTRALQGSSDLIGALWSVISGIVVLQATRQETWASAGLRVLGTLIGAIISALYLLALPFSALGMAVSIGLTVWLCHYLRIPGHARLAAITVAVIMVVSQYHPDINPVMNAALRFGESCLGAALAVAAALAWPGRGKRQAV